VPSGEGKRRRVPARVNGPARRTTRGSGVHLRWVSALRAVVGVALPTFSSHRASHSVRWGAVSHITNHTLLKALLFVRAGLVILAYGTSTEA